MLCIIKIIKKNFFIKILCFSQTKILFFALNWQIIQKHINWIRHKWILIAQKYHLHLMMVVIYKNSLNSCYWKSFLFFCRAFANLKFKIFSFVDSQQIFFFTFLLKLFLSTPSTAPIKVSTLLSGGVDWKSAIKIVENWHLAMQ